MFLQIPRKCCSLPCTALVGFSGSATGQPHTAGRAQRAAQRLLEKRTLKNFDETQRTQPLLPLR